MQRASVGRMVHYRGQPEEPPQAAILVHVFQPDDADSPVNLIAFSSTGKVHAETHVGRFVGQAGAAWDWPAYVPPFGSTATEPEPTSPNVMSAIAAGIEKAMVEAGVDPNVAGDVTVDATAEVDELDPTTLLAKPLDQLTEAELEALTAPSADASAEIPAVEPSEPATAAKSPPKRVSARRS